MLILLFFASAKLSTQIYLFLWEHFYLLKRSNLSIFIVLGKSPFHTIFLLYPHLLVAYLLFFISWFVLRALIFMTEILLVVFHLLIIWLCTLCCYYPHFIFFAWHRINVLYKILTVIFSVFKNLAAVEGFYLNFLIIVVKYLNMVIYPA